MSYINYSEYDSQNFNEFKDACKALNIEPATDEEVWESVKGSDEIPNFEDTWYSVTGDKILSEAESIGFNIDDFCLTVNSAASSISIDGVRVNRGSLLNNICENYFDNVDVLSSAEEKMNVKFFYHKENVQVDSTAEKCTITVDPSEIYYVEDGFDENSEGTIMITELYERMANSGVSVEIEIKEVETLLAP